MKTRILYSMCLRHAICVLMCFAMLLSISACGGKKEDKPVSSISELKEALSFDSASDAKRIDSLTEEIKKHPEIWGTIDGDFLSDAEFQELYDVYEATVVRLISAYKKLQNADLSALSELAELSSKIEEINLDNWKGKLSPEQLARVVVLTEKLEAAANN